MIYIRQIPKPYPCAGYYEIKVKTKEKYSYVLRAITKEITQEILTLMKNKLAMQEKSQ